jgi:hypothetical protein
MTDVQLWGGIRRLLIPALLLLASTLAAPARAGLIFTIQELGEVAPGSGEYALDVLVTNDGLADVRIDAFSFALEGSAGVTFTNATLDTVVAPYLFAGHSFFGDILVKTGPPLLASDLYDDIDGFAVLGAGGTLALGHVVFEVAPRTSPYTITLLGYPDTGASYRGADILPPTPAVPEPSTAILALAGLATLGAWSRLRGR